MVSDLDGLVKFLPGGLGFPGRCFGMVVKIRISFECEAARGKQDRSGGEPSGDTWIRVS